MTGKTRFLQVEELTVHVKSLLTTVERPGTDCRNLGVGLSSRDMF